MNLSDSELGQLVREVMRAGEINFPNTLSSLQDIQPTEIETEKQSTPAMPEPTITDYTLTVNYDLSIEEMVEAGKYDKANPNITSDNFPVAGHGSKELVTKTIHYDYYITTEEVIADLDKRGLRPATPAKILKFGEMYPNLQEEFPIIALGQIWAYLNGHRDVIALDSDGRGRDLDLISFDNVWGTHCRFLAVEK